MSKKTIKTSFIQQLTNIVCCQVSQALLMTDSKIENELWRAQTKKNTDAKFNKL